MISHAQGILARYAKLGLQGLLIERLCLFAAITLCFIALSRSVPSLIWLWLSCAAGLIVWQVIWPLWYRAGQYRPLAIAEHFNSQIGMLEHSAHLLLSDAELNVLQRIQREKIAKVMVTAEQQGLLKQAMPSIRYKKALLWLAAGIALLLAHAWFEHQQRFVVESPDRLEQQQPLALLSMSIEVFPPRYTGLSPQTHTKADIQVVEGAKVRWHLRFSDNSKRYRIMLGDKALELAYQGDDQSFVAEKVVDTTGLYSIASDGQQLPGIYSLSVIKDKSPKVRLLEPRQSFIEIEKSGSTEFTVKATVEEDYGVKQVQILASLAKGSGEAVKFRDSRFEFDKVSLEQTKTIYHKHWDLKSLGMESGDEIYFTVIATDNKPGGGQQGRSNTVIVRWLDDEPETVLADGVQLNYMPEYYRSQRQIIIETEQLIADKSSLEVVRFNQLSGELGQAQGDLKLRYGQYLGNESEFEPTGANTQHEDEHEHQQGEEKDEPFIASQEQVLERFTHHHEDVLIGETSIHNPRSMMKKALGNMWQAELHLLLSEPQKALPFAREADRYLKLAKQAQRIYVKRLGFEPPPVSLERRLTGELKDIPKRKVEQTEVRLDDKAQVVFRQGFRVLSELSLQDTLTSEQRQSLEKAKSTLTEMANKRPGLIRYAAIAQRILTSNATALSQCENCAAQLQQKLWQLLDSSRGMPNQGWQPYFDEDAMAKQYLQQVEILNGAAQ